MSEDKEIKRRQHYIPRFILKNYSIDKKQKLIYQYDKDNEVEHIANIASVCQEEFLYEVVDNPYDDEDGNLLEDYLSSIEKVCSPIVKKALKHQKLEEKDEQIIIFMMIIQCLRTPDVLNMCSQLLDKHFPHISKKDKDNFVKVSSILVTDDENVSFLQWAALDKVSNMKLSVVYSDDIFLLNGSWPVIAPFLNKLDSGKFDVLYFPFDKHHCFRLSHGKRIPQYEKFNSEITAIINTIIYGHEGRFIYASESIEKIKKTLRNDLRFADK